MGKLRKFVFYVEPELGEKIEALAKKQRRSVSSFVCLAVEEAIAKQSEDC